MVNNKFVNFGEKNGIFAVISSMSSWIEHYFLTSFQNHLGYNYFGRKNIYHWLIQEIKFFKI